MLLSLNIPQADPRLFNVDWRRALPRLQRWALGYWARSLAPYKGAPEPNDLVEEAIDAFLQGRRTWPQGMDPRVLEDLLAVLINVMKSIAWNYIRLDMIELLDKDPDLKPRHLAEMLGVGVEAVYAARKRLKRILRNFTA